ncbi:MULTISPECIES: sigma-E processing peptidase SpoIIGA [Solibacillus]|uniref:Sigma-E processing peptidase SpoIIGA n=1 Tax=Solibacillus merdavium TaxID=2762218 RepID=A0ABR8XI91_9BACL|nr:sigma-E processing peptidase SpoIIGA [Solibacillus merdavium]MBD8031660.1 sigma-E processing peptidase SpoIIGA [Solibacillus merdavium]
MYAEWILLMNFLMNLVLLKFTATMTYTIIPIWRLILAAFSSAMIAVLFMGNIFMLLVSFILLLGIAFSFKWKIFFEQGKWIVIATLLAGGLLTALQPFLLASPFFAYIFICFGIVCISLTIMRKGWFQKLQQVAQSRYVTTSKVELLDMQLELLTYIDTGNESTEPFSQAPVHFISFKSVQSMLSQEFNERLLAWSETEPYSLTMFSKEVQKRIRIVPITTVQKGTVLVPAFRASITVGDKAYPNHYVVFTKNDARFPQNAQMIAHVFVLTNS